MVSSLCEATKGIILGSSTKSLYLLVQNEKLHPLEGLLANFNTPKRLTVNRHLLEAESTAYSLLTTGSCRTNSGGGPTKEFQLKSLQKKPNICYKQSFLRYSTQSPIGQLSNQRLCKDGKKRKHFRMLRQISTETAT